MRKISEKIFQKWPKSAKLNKKFAQNIRFLPKFTKEFVFLSKNAIFSSNFPLKIPKFSQNSRKIAILMTILSIFGVFLSKNAPVSATSLTLTVPSNLSLDISPSSSGTFVKSDPGQISVSTDNSSGYTLNIKAKNSENSNDLLNGGNKLLSISSNLTEDQYKGAGNLNTWGYLPSKLNSAVNTSFLPGPTAEETILDKAEGSSSGSNDYDLTLAAKVDSSLAAGSYANTFILSVSANTPKIDGTMQTWHGCGSLQDGQIATLRDERDDSTYRVAKLADGKCWMIDNLKIVDKEISPVDSDMASGNFAIPASSIDGFDGSNYDGDWAYYGGLKDDQGNDYGAHYSWHVATAGTGTQSMSSGDATSSICPKGWRLPKGGANGDFVALDKAMGGTGSNRNDVTARDRFIKKPIPGFTYAGFVSGSSLSLQGSYGNYWSSTADNTGVASNLSFDTDGFIYPRDGNSKYYGYPVRCIARETMQNVEDWGPDVQEGETVTAVDERDGSTYTVSRLKDGKLWMTQNLRIVNKKITDADSDLQPGASFTIPAGNDLSAFNNTKDLTAVYYANNTTNGAYYTWRAATADTGRYSMSSGNATSSICPKGWRLPTGGSNGEFQQLYNQYNSYSLMTNTSGPHFVIAGYVYSGSLRDVGSYGYYWSSTANSPGYAYYLFFNSPKTSVNPTNYNYEYYGGSVRCVARDPEPSPELLTQQWTADADEINVSVGKGIEMIMIADGSDNWKPYYAFPGKDVNLSGASGKKYIISVVPEANKVMTKFTKENGKISATGGDGSYESMQDFSQCTEQGTNVTDVRNGASYTVAKIGNKCWMLSNLRLAAGTTLTSSDSNVTSNFTLPTEAWTSSSQNYYSKKIMKECHGTAGNDPNNTTCNNTATGVTEYYYNWYAAKANDAVGSSPTSSSSATSSLDSQAKGSICPKNWSLPDYSSDVTGTNAWNGGANPGMLATVGYFGSGAQGGVGSFARWWSTTRNSSYDDFAYRLYFDGTSANRDDSLKYFGYSVRCMR